MGGYYLVRRGDLSPSLGSGILPSSFISVSPHISEVIPDSWILGWGDDPASDEYRQLLGLNQSQFEELQIQFNKHFQRHEFGFPNVFLSLDLARKFFRTFSEHLSQFCLLGVALHEENLDSFIEEHRPASDIGEAGVRRKLRAQEPVSQSRKIRGYEVLGFDGAAFCSFVCNSLQKDYQQELEIDFNPNGLISDYDEAKLAARYTMRDDVGAEPYSWYPWLILEYSLENLGSG